MTSVTQAITTALFQFVWQGALVGAALWCALILFEKRSAGLRYVVSCTAMAVMVLLPAITAYRAYSRPSSPSAVLQAASPAGSSITPPTGEKPISSNRLALLRAWALPIWLFGVLVCSLRLIWCGRQVGVLRRSAEAAGESISRTVQQLSERLHSSRRVRVLISRVVDGPSVLGWIRPIILIPPSSLTGLSPEQLEAVLAHEVAHIRRYDDLVNMFQALAEALLFYHPVVWWNSACIRRERELCCDDLAIAVTRNSMSYARALVQLERMRLSSTTALALGAAAESLSYRIRRIVGERGPEASQTNMSGVAALCICVGLVVFAIDPGRMHGQTEQPLAPGAKAIVISQGPAGLIFNQVPEAPGAQVSFAIDAPGVTVDPGGANLLHRTGVEYPQSVRVNGIEGTVTLEVTLAANGYVTDARVLAGPIELRRVCLQSVLQWLFAADSANATRQVAIRFDSKVASTSQPWMDRALVEAKQRAEKERLSGEKLAELMTSEGPMRVRVIPMPDGSQLVTSTTSVESLRARVAELQRESEQLAKTYTSENPELNEVESQIEQAREQLERELKLVAMRKQEQAALQAQLEAESGSNDARVAVLENLAKGETGLRQAAGRALVAGRTLKGIVFNGVSETSEGPLFKLPVKVGDTLTEDSLSALLAVVGSYDEHLVVTFRLVGSNEAVLNISARQ